MLSGGVKLDTWQVSPDGRWHMLLADVKAGKWSFTQLFVNDQRRFRPRLPRHGYYTIAREIPPTEKGGRKWNDRFGYAGNDVRAEWAGGDVEIVPFCAWFAARRHVAAIDPAERVVTLAEVDKWPDCMPLPKGERFLVDNVREALGEPGDWYLDRHSGELTYVPAPGEEPQKTTVIAPRAERLLVIEGDLKNHHYVEHLRFLGLTLAHSNWVMTSRGQAAGQSESNMDGAVSVSGGRNLVFDGCAVRHVGDYAMAFGSGCRDNLIENCELFDMAAGGLKIGHAGDGPVPRGGDPELLASHHTVRQCLVAHGGRKHAEAAGIWIGDCPYNVVEHNDIYDFYQIGVSLGWTWGYYESQAHHNDVGYNHIHTLGQGVLSDMGARLYPGRLARHPHSRQSHPRHPLLQPRLRRLGPLQRRGLQRHRDGEQPRLPRLLRLVPPALRQGESRPQQHLRLRHRGPNPADPQRAAHPHFLRAQHRLLEQQEPGPGQLLGQPGQVRLQPLLEPCGQTDPLLRQRDFVPAMAGSNSARINTRWWPIRFSSRRRRTISGSRRARPHWPSASSRSTSPRRGGPGRRR